MMVQHPSGVEIHTGDSVMISTALNDYDANDWTTATVLGFDWIGTETLLILAVPPGILPMTRYLTEVQPIKQQTRLARSGFRLLRGGKDE